MFRILLPGTFQELLFALPANRWLLMASSPLRMYHQDLCHATRKYEGYAAKPASSMRAPRHALPSSAKAAGGYPVLDTLGVAVVLHPPLVDPIDEPPGTIGRPL